MVLGHSFSTLAPLKIQVRYQRTEDMLSSILMKSVQVMLQVLGPLPRDLYELRKVLDTVLVRSYVANSSKAH